MKKVYSVEEICTKSSYPGRGMIIGSTSDGKSLIAYFIMGRSENSRNRVFELKEGDVYTAPFIQRDDMDKSLVIYRAVAFLRAENSENKGTLIVSNGDQTDTIYTFLRNGDSFSSALATREYEPDSPNFTPRISAVVDFENGDFDYRLSIIKKNEGKDAPKREVFDITKRCGCGYFISTYEKNGNPLPSFCGIPKQVALPDCDIDSLARLIWQNLDSENKISLYVRVTDPVDMSFTDRIWNKHR